MDSDKDKIKWYTALKNYVAPGKAEESPNLVRTLLALGDSAEVRCLGTLDQFYVESKYIVDQLYAVTFMRIRREKDLFCDRPHWPGT